MNVLVLTGYDKAMEPIGKLAEPGIAKYAKRHNCDFICFRHFRTEVHPCWVTLEAVNHYLAFYDAVFWIGADVVVTNYDAGIEFINNPGFHASQDWGTNAYDISCFSAGSYACTKEAEPILRSSLARGHIWANRPLWDQSAFREVYQSDIHLRHLFNIHPRRFFNAVPKQLHGEVVDPWQPGDRFCHVTGVSVEAKAKFVIDNLMSYLPDNCLE